MIIKSKDLIHWSSKRLDKNNLIFDKILDIYDDILFFIKNNNLNLNNDKEIFLMQLLVLIYNNSFK